MTQDAAPLDADARAQCAVVAALLHGSRGLGLLAAMAVAALLVVGVLGAGLSLFGPWLIGMSLLLFGVERVLALRVALDATLFADLAAGRIADLTALDTALQQALHVPVAKAGRPLDARIAGARRLLRVQGLALLALVALALIGVALIGVALIGVMACPR